MTNFINFKQTFIFLFFLSSFIFVSCQKENSEEHLTHQNSEMELRTTIIPVVENGTLKFTSKEQAFEYLEQLNALLEEGESGSDTSEIHVNPATLINNKLKTDFGFTSLWDSQPKDEDYYLIEPVFPDVALNLMMNQNYEIIIGDKIFVHKNVFETYSVLKTDAFSINVLRNHPINTELPVEKMFAGIEIESMGPRVINRTVNGDCRCNITIEESSFGIVLPGQRRFILKYSCDGLVGNPEYNLSYSWGTIKSGPVVSPSVPGQIEFYIPEQHVDLLFKFCVTQDCGQGRKLYCYDLPVNVANTCCKKIIDLRKEEVVTSNPDVSIRTRVRNGTNAWGYWHWSQVECISTAKKNRLKASKLENWLSIVARSAPNSNDPCIIKETDTDYDSCTNCKENSENIYLTSHNLHHKVGDGKFDFKLVRHSKSQFTSTVPDYCN